MKEIFIILKLINSANREGRTITLEDFPLEKMKISEDYLHVLLKNLFDAGYIDGIEELEGMEPISVCLHIPTVTLAGLDYLENNTTMKKFWETLKDLKATIPML